MGKKDAGIYLNEKIKELLGRADAFQSKVNNDKERYFSLQQQIATHKHNNPKGTYEDVRGELVEMQETHYYAFLLEQNLRDTLVKIEELTTMADILGVKLDLDDSQERGIKDIRGGTGSIIFNVTKDGNVTFMDTPENNHIKAVLDSKKESPQTLENMYKNFRVAAV
jgi:hypothetical protein